MALEYNYDEEGETWPFFVMAVLTFILVPLTIKWIRKAVSSNDPLTQNKKVKGSIVEDHKTLQIDNFDKIKKFQSKKKSAKIFNKTLLVLIIGWALVIYIALYYTKEANLQGSFDPYTILDVSITASEREIKSRYRKLSLKFHPDKLPQDVTQAAREEMETAFIKINLAYKALTDEVTKSNFQKYGHPDGPQDVSHGIAIPKFLVEGYYSPFMVVLYFFLIGVLLPTIVGVWWNNVKSHTKRGIHVETAAMFVRKLADRNPGKVMTPYDLLDWLIASNEIQTEFKHLGPNQIRDLISKYLFRNDKDLDAKLQNEKLKLISVLPKLLNGFIEIAAAFRGVDIIIAATDLQKAIVQAVRPTGRYQELLQLPYVDAKVISQQPIKKLGKLLTLSEEEAGKVLGITDSTKLKKALEVASHIPQFRILEAEFKVPGDEIVPPKASSHLSIKFLIKSPKLKSCPDIPDERLVDEETMDYLRDPLKINEEQPLLPFTYSPYFPNNIRNAWNGFIIAQKDTKLVEGSTIARLENADLSNIEISQDQWISGKEGDVAIGTFKIPFTNPTPASPGKYHFRLILKNNGYFGSDVDIPLVMEVENPPPPKIDAAKLKAKLEGTEESDDESDISDPEEDTLAGALAALNGGNVKKSVKEDEDSDESDNESVFTDINTDTEDEGN